MSAPRCWLAWLTERPPDAHAVAAVRLLDGSSSGWLAAWTDSARPHPDARRIDPAAVDADGPAAAVSVTWPERNRWPLFDDPAVVRAIRLVASVPQVRAVSTLTADATHFAGSLLATDVSLIARWPGWWSVDPFAPLAPRYKLIVGAGLLARRPAVLGPGTQRRAGAPWPAPW